MNSDSNILKPEEYLGESYLNKERWASYSIQADLVHNFFPLGEILEIGIGNGIITEILRKKYNLTTVDINPCLNPDVVSSVDDLSGLPEYKFDASLCFEVLEHLSFKDFSKCLSELHRVTRHYIFLSLPYWGYTFGLKLKLPFLSVKQLKFKISGLKKHKFNGQHYWEIGKKGYSLKMIKKEINNSSLKIIKSFWDIDDPYHYYFVLKK